LAKAENMEFLKLITVSFVAVDEAQVSWIHADVACFPIDPVPGSVRSRGSKLNCTHAVPNAGQPAVLTVAGGH
jgi:hypothetical protein